MKVLKFGGSSVKTPERIRNIASILSAYDKQGEKFTVVFSAFSGVTDSLVEMGKLAAEGKESYKALIQTFRERHHETAKALLSEDRFSIIKKELDQNHDVLENLLYGIFLVREASPRTMDYVLSFGERNSAFIISHFLDQEGIRAEYLDARKVIKTDKNFSSASVRFEDTYEKIREYFSSREAIQIVTGFISSAKGGLTTTLGRGGSDYTASLLAAGLNADSVEIWTDVDGVLTADPRKVQRAFTIPSMTYQEAMEMSHFGAKVIYPPTLQPELSKEIPLYIKNTFNPKFRGTHISSKSTPNGHAVKGISSIGHVALLTLQGGGLFGVPGIAARLFQSLADAKINIILITQGSSEHSISFAIQPHHARKAKRLVEKAFEYEMNMGLINPIKVEEDLSVVAIIGEHMRYKPGISGRLFRALGKNGINCIAIAQGSSELNISVVIERENESKALNALHDAFFLSETKILNVFMVGVGLIGSTLLKQLQQQASYLKEKLELEIKIVGMANTKKMLFDNDGIDLDNWYEELMASDEISDLEAFVGQMIHRNLSNSIFIDNTASDLISHFYEKILDNSISISTPNKIATSSSYEQYQKLKKVANNRGVQFKYETNVGAGLPVISTLNDLIKSGDQIVKIEGVLSGSLSFIFNTFTPGTSFSTVVRQAGELGYTEPDPRIDLNGIDVRRKLIILARETGLSLESKDVEITSILPEACQAAETIDEFFKALEESNAYFDQLIQEASAKNEKLRMIACLDNGKAKIGLQSVGPDNPFYSLNGSDNMIVFTTQRYHERPLVVRGPGAGAEVTAAGVFAELITIGNYL